MSAISRLPGRQREAIKRLWHEGLNYPAIAARLDLSQHIVRYHCERMGLRRPPHNAPTHVEPDQRTTYRPGVDPRPDWLVNRRTGRRA